MDASLKVTPTGRAVPSVLTLDATLSMLGHACHGDCTWVGEADARVRFIHRPVCPVPGSAGSLVVVDFASTDLPVTDRLRLLREVNRCARRPHSNPGPQQQRLRCTDERFRLPATGRPCHPICPLDYLDYPPTSSNRSSQ